MAANNRKDLTGMVFKYLTVVEYAYTEKKRAHWVCKCKCGNIVTKIGKNLLNGSIMSCGCYNNKVRGERVRTHGLSDLPEYSIWKDIRKRCYNKNSWAYKYYGGRGITMSEEWYSDFANFYRDMGPRPGDLTVDRIDCNLNYCKENCRWATMQEQCNNKRNNVRYNVSGEALTIAQIARRMGVSYNSIYHDVHDKGMFPRI